MRGQSLRLMKVVHGYSCDAGLADLFSMKREFNFLMICDLKVYVTREELELFTNIHDPTTLFCKGKDHGLWERDWFVGCYIWQPYSLLKSIT